jgi:hypothetical protein
VSARTYPPFGTWLLSCALAIPVGGFSVFYILFHLGLRIELASLARPFLISSVLTLLLAPALYWCQKQDALYGGDHKRLYFVAGCYTLAIFLTYIHFGAKVGLVPTTYVKPLILLAVIFIPAIYLGGFYLRRTFLRA